MSTPEPNRRPLKTRSKPWARQAALLLTRRRISPNQISLASLAFAALGLVLLLVAATPIGLIICAACIQARLACNLLDGMVAIEGGQQSALGQLYNEFPDRIADALLLVALGYAIQLAWLGWLSALLAVLTAYIRVFGGSLGLPQDFTGPMAKPHRMAVLTAGCLLGALEQSLYGTRYALTGAAIIIAFGAAITCVRRTRSIARQLRQR
jgi:phosphatidylglycerophosphate synthase